MNVAAQFIRGLVAPFKGFAKIASSGRLILLAIVPFWLCLFLAFYCIVKFWGTFPVIVPYLMSWVPGLYEFTEKLKIGEFSLLGAIFQGVFWVFLIIFASYFSYISVSIIGSPFYSLLADEVLKRKGARPPGASGFLHWFYTTLKMLVINVVKLMFFLALAFILMVLAFLPIGMVIVPFLMALMISFDCFDVSFECMNMSLPGRFRFFKNHIFAFLGLSLIIVLTGSVPGLFILTLPAFIAGCADLFADLNMRSLQ